MHCYAEHFIFVYCVTLCNVYHLLQLRMVSSASQKGTPPPLECSREKCRKLEGINGSHYCQTWGHCPALVYTNHHNRQSQNQVIFSRVETYTNHHNRQSQNYVIFAKSFCDSIHHYMVSDISFQWVWNDLGYRVQVDKLQEDAALQQKCKIAKDAEILSACFQLKEGFFKTWNVKHTVPKNTNSNHSIDILNVWRHGYKL